MKLTFVLLTAVFFNVSAKSLSQQVTLSVKNASIQEVLTEIEKQTGYVFVYTDPILSNMSAVSIKADHLPLKQFLEELFDGQPVSFNIKRKTIILSNRKIEQKASSSAMDKEDLVPLGSTKGRVTNEDGEPLAGASVTIKGSNLGVKTDNNGYYKIEGVAAGEHILEISYVGYATKTATIKVIESGASTFDIILTPSLVNLDKITVASTLSSRMIRSVPTTMAVIEQKDLKNRNLNNIADVLGSIPGIIITPGSEFDNSGGGGINYRQPQNLLIRGTSTNAQIKYLIDGVEIVSSNEGSILQTMDPNDIQKIEILKGPMASTLYGSGAAGGIISITTKKGKPGKTKVNFKTMFTDRSNDYADYKGYQQDYSLNVSGGSEQFNYLIGVGYNLYPTTKLTDINNGIDQKT